MSCIPEGAGSKDKCVKSSKVGKKFCAGKKCGKKIILTFLGLIRIKLKCEILESLNGTLKGTSWKI